MARHPRFALPGFAQHVIQRGNNRDIIFVDEEDYQLYRDRLAQACERFRCAIHAYVFMTNHVHLLMTPQTPTAISQVMQSLGRVYVQHFNYRYRRTGTLWEGRFKASVIGDQGVRVLEKASTMLNLCVEKFTHGGARRGKRFTKIRDQGVRVLENADPTRQALTCQTASQKDLRYGATTQERGAWIASARHSARQ